MASIRHFAAGAALLLAAGPALAVERTVTFTGTVPSANSYFANCGGGGGCPLTTSQQQFFNGINFGSTFDFTFRYDTATVAAGGAYAATLVSGRVASFTDFSGFTPTIRLSQNGPGGAWDVMDFALDRLDLFVPANFNRFTSGVYFTLVDNQGLLFGSGLPGTIDPASLEQRNVEFRVTSRSSGDYRSIIAQATVGTAAVPPPGGGPAVPEPAGWAMMILGFGVAGAAIRRQGGWRGAAAVIRPG